MKEFPAELFQAIVGKRIVSVRDHELYDEGLNIETDDGQILVVSFSGCEGNIAIYKKKGYTA